jgi:hypothetical protein
MIMNDEFWDVVGSEVEESRVWRCHRYLDDAWTADQETQLFDVICGYAITDKSGDKVKTNASNVVFIVSHVCVVVHFSVLGQQHDRAESVIIATAKYLYDPASTISANHTEIRSI